MDVQQSSGFVIWVTGMNRAGKSTLAAHIASRFTAAGRRVELLDEGGDAALLLEGLGPSMFVDCSMEKLQQRDPEGVYKRALAGELKQVPGVDAPYEPPGHADVTVHTDQVPVPEAGTRVFQALVDLKYVGPTEFGRLTGGQRPRRGKPAKAARGGSRKKLQAKAAARKAPRKVAARTARPVKRGR